jgi:hypothetical protein
MMDFRQSLDEKHPRLRRLFCTFSENPFVVDDWSGVQDAPITGLILDHVVQADYFQSLSQQRSKICVWKVGRTTGLTRGILQRTIPAIYRCDHQAGAYVQDVQAAVTTKPDHYGLGFRGLIIDDKNPNERFADGGDSGSLVFFMQDKHAVGIGVVQGELKTGAERGAVVMSLITDVAELNVIPVTASTLTSIDWKNVLQKKSKKNQQPE